MEEKKDVLTRHEIAEILEDAIVTSEQYWGDTYLGDKLKVLAYQIAKSEAPTSGGDEEKAKKAEQKGMVKVMLDAYKNEQQGVITPSQFRSMIYDLSDDDVANIIGWAQQCGEQLKTDTNKSNSRDIHILGPLPDESVIASRLRDRSIEEILSWLKECTTTRSKGEESEPQEPRNNIETTIGNLQKAMLALNLIAKLFTKEEEDDENK